MLTLPRLVARNLGFHWRSNLAALLGVAVGSAVLTGALLVGDSLRGSLRAKADRQLAGVDAAAFFPRPLRAAVAGGLPGTTAPALVLPGSVQADTGDPAARSLGRVTVYGVDGRFGPAAKAGIDWSAKAKRGAAPIALSHRVASQLGVAVGDKVRVGVQRFSDLPRSSSLARRGAEDVTAAVAYTVTAVLPPGAPAGEFSLNPSPAAPLNVFVPITALSDQARDESDRSDAPLATAVFAWGAGVGELDAALKTRLRAEDYGVRLRLPRREKYVSIESDQLVLSPALVEAVTKAAADLKVRAEPTVVYVADTLSSGTRELPYPVLAGLNPAAPAPLGPFLPRGVDALKDDEVVLPDWAENPFRGLAPGSPLTLTYYHPDVEGEGKVLTAALTFRGFIPLTGAANDRDLTPTVRGITDERANLFDWDRPPMLPKDRIRARVPDNGPRAKFWNTYRATPMAYVNLATAERLFAGRFGTVTSVRVAPAEGEPADQLSERFEAKLLTHLDPAAAGLGFDPVRDRLLAASRGGTDFGGLFLGFSFFLIAAALMLVGLLFRLAMDRRAKEIGLLLATGYGVRHVRRLVLAEGLLLAAVGAAVGLGAAVGYNRVLLGMLLRLWPDPEVGTFLEPHATALSFTLGFGLTVLMAGGALWLSIRGLVRVAPPALLRGETAVPTTGAADRPRRARWLLLGIPVGLGLIAAGSFVANPDYRAMTFFSGGGLLLTAALAAAWVWMTRARHAEVNGRGFPALARLGTRNAARNPGRSLLTAALLASAAFLLVAVESFRREPGRTFEDKAGGSGGFNLVAEADVPLYQLFDAGAGRDDLEKQLRDAYHGNGADPRYQAAAAELAALTPGPDGANVFGLRLKGGDDASCMNLYQATRPRVLGVPESLIVRGGFHFYETETETPEERANPWLLLNRTYPDGSVPVFAENNTAVWMLHVMVGGTVTVPDDSGNEVKLRLVGTLTDSPFQSELLMADARFVKLYPTQGGYRVFLVHTPPGKERDVARVLETALRPNGFVATPTRDRVAAYQAVVGAYLSTFQLLGGFGLLLGVLGLAVVVLRGVWERVGELALLRAVGYRPRALQVLVLSENTFLLLLGLAAGVLAALASVAPHVAGGAAVPWGRLAVMLGGVLVVGFSVAAAATAGILRVPVVPALRRE
ncbi:MAG TPA: FtsX-like permease family protein [Urbifossiella sp.]|nr:FtsX-like permease family protein [Urbifossiella sp.]